MSAPKKEYRKRHLFARSLDEVVKAATKPMMDKQGKLYGALLANWPQIAGERAKITRPGRLQFPAKDATAAILHLNVHPAHAPALQYETEQLIEACARYFGYRAITRIILHPAHELAKEEAKKPPRSRDGSGEPQASAQRGGAVAGASAPPREQSEPIKAPPKNMAELLQRLQSRIKKPH